MDSNTVRVAVALLLAALLWAQARRASDRPRRRRAFELAAGALLALAAFNGALQIAVAAVGVALLIAALIALIGSFRSGEMHSQRDRIAAAAQEYRERRAENDDR